VGQIKSNTPLLTLFISSANPCLHRELQSRSTKMGAQRERAEATDQIFRRTLKAIREYPAAPAG
jgi:hypothetical protein